MNRSASSIFLSQTIRLVLILVLLTTLGSAVAKDNSKTKKGPSKTSSKVAPKKYTNDMLAASDIKRGKELSVGCTACHTFKKGVKSLDKQKTVTQRAFMGPNLYGIFGKEMATGEYPYSAALKKLKKNGKVWNVDELYSWLRSPSIYAPGTYMVFGGMGDPQDRLDLIAYIATLK